jgi:heme/copper-type cytochrome/quinol oxidase subunit 2
VRLTKWICVLLVAVLLATVAQPARAEAMDPILISLAISGAIVVIAIIAILIIANASEGRRRRGEDTTPPERIVAYQYVVISTQSIGTQPIRTESP